jgi:thermitase
MQREQRYQEMLVKVRSDDDSTFSIGGMLFPVTWDVEDPDPVSAELLVGQRTETVASQFQQTLQTATQQIEAERSIVVSTFEESEHREATSRTIVNENDCRAVTYYMRRVLECYELVTRVVEISWRGRSPNRKVMGPWRPLDDLGDIDKHCIEFVKRQLEELPRVGEQVTAPRTFTVPTDGTVINAELAHCSSCEPERAARIRIELEQAHSEARRLCAEAELQELEVQRRRALLEQGVFQPFEDLLLIADQAEDNAI